MKSEMFQTEAESIRQLLADGWIGRAEYNTRMADLRWKAAVKYNTRMADLRWKAAVK